MADLPQPRDSRLVVATAVGIPLLVIAVVLFCFDPSRHSFFPKCAFHETTGLLCAGCGATRAAYQLLHGHWATAFRYNPLLVACLPLFLGIGARQFLRFLRNQPCGLEIRPVWLWIFLGVFVVFTIARNLPGLPTAWLPPDSVPSAGLRATR